MANEEMVFSDEKNVFFTLDQHREALKKFTVKRLGLFGSFARGEPTTQSDIDFLVDLQKPSFDNFMNLVFYLEKLFGRRVDLVTKGNLSPYIQPFVEKEIKWYETK